MNVLLVPIFDVETFRQAINTSSQEVLSSGVGDNIFEAAEGATSELSRPSEVTVREMTEGQSRQSTRASMQNPIPQVETSRHRSPSPPSGRQLL